MNKFLWEHRYQRLDEPVTHMDILNKKKYHIHGCGMHVQGSQYDWRKNWDYANHEQNCDNCTFLNLYSKPTANRTLLERMNEFAGPIVVDIDLKSEEEKPLYMKEQVLSLVKIFQTVIRDNVTTPLTEDSFKCYVLEKAGYFKDQVYKNGFHLHFPHVWLSAKDRREINNLVRLQNPCFELDDNIIYGNWLMYGSCKNMESGQYLVTYIIERTRTNVMCTESFTELVWLLSVTPRWDTVVSELVGSEKPNVLDLTTTQSNVIDFNSAPEYSCNEQKPKTDATRTKKCSYDQLKHYIDQLSDIRSEDYMYWKSVGFAIFNECDNDIDGKKLWHEFSKRCPKKYNKHVCDEFWERAGKTKFSLGTIICYIKHDNDGVFARYKKPKPKIMEKIDVIEECILYNFPNLDELTPSEREILVCTMRRPEWGRHMWWVESRFSGKFKDEYDKIMEELDIVKSKHNMKSVVEIFRKYVYYYIPPYTWKKWEEKWNERVLFSLKKSGKMNELKSNQPIEKNHEEEIGDEELITELERQEDIWYS